MVTRAAGPAAALRLRAAGAGDLRFVSRLADEAFAAYGDYARLLTEWATTPGVETTIAEEAGMPVGLTLLAFFKSTPPPAWIADLLAIAVASDARGRGLGRTLLEAALTRVAEVNLARPLVYVRLSVAEENAVARALFERAGFDYVDDEQGHYPRGQRALHMRRPIVDRVRTAR
jgi:ribosomal protein S18 acetylase RimI-like enzyme